ncbi:MAG: hypothetical protein LBS66_03855 [Rhodospirillaceae bacterium]|nr:hypothetical protein [Rhodospirillaceae bacterium]
MFRFFSTLIVIISFNCIKLNEVIANPIAIIELLDANVDYMANFYINYDKDSFYGSIIHTPGCEKRDFKVFTEQQILLLRRDIDQVAILWPDRKCYVKTKFSSLINIISGFSNIMINRTAEKKEKISGENTTRYRVSIKSASGSCNFHGNMWFTNDNVLIKLAGKITIKNKQIPIETGIFNFLRVKTDSSVFELPHGYMHIPLDITKLFHLH